MLISSWNVNSVRARILNIKEYLKKFSPDILMIQEIKTEDKNYPYDEIKSLTGFKNTTMNLNKNFSIKFGTNVAEIKDANKSLDSILRQGNIDWNNPQEKNKVMKDIERIIQVSYSKQVQLAKYLNNFKKLEINLSNVNLSERQVETDQSRLERGQITLADVAQSESSLAGAKAKFTEAKNEVFTGKLNYENVIGLISDIKNLENGKNSIWAGESAGGGLSTGLAVDDSFNIKPDKLVLLSPWLDLSDRNRDRSYLKNKDILLALDGMHFVGEYYAGEFDPTDPILSPVFADINNFPETLIQVCSNELLYNDAIEFTKKLREKGTKYELQVWDDLWHAWHFFPIKESSDALKKIVNFITSDSYSSPK